MQITIWAGVTCAKEVIAEITEQVKITMNLIAKLYKRKENCAKQFEI